MHSSNLFKQILEETRHIWDRPETRPAVRTEFAAVIDCGTPALGWRVYASESEERRCYFRCKSRFCPSCGHRSMLQWLKEQEAALPDIPYSGMVFTMPSELWGIFRKNRHLLHDLPTLAADVIQRWISMKCRAKAHILVVPHTFGGDLKFHCHLHILVSSGGIEEATGHWVSSLRLDRIAIGRMWRYAVIAHLRRAVKVGVLSVPIGMNPIRPVLSSAHERHPRWVILWDNIVSKSHFLRYAARYIRRPPIAMWRILRIVDGEVKFVAKDTKNKRMACSRCTLDQFVRLLAAHVPERYDHGIRYFGLLAPQTKHRLEAGVLLSLGQSRKPRPRRLTWRELMKKSFGSDPMTDSAGAEMHWV